MTVGDQVHVLEGSGGRARKGRELRDDAAQRAAQVMSMDLGAREL